MKFLLNHLLNLVQLPYNLFFFSFFSFFSSSSSPFSLLLLLLFLLLFLFFFSFFSSSSSSLSSPFTLLLLLLLFFFFFYSLFFSFFIFFSLSPDQQLHRNSLVFLITDTNFNHFQRGYKIKIRISIIAKFKFCKKSKNKYSICEIFREDLTL